MMENQTKSKKERTDYQSGRDLLSDLPLSIIHTILALVPFKDAVKTSLLSRQWRYTWNSLPYLVFEDECESLDYDISYRFKERMKNIITHALFRHKGPILKFKLSVSFLDNHPNIDEWILCLSRNEIRELILDMGYDHDSWSEVYSSVYSCNKLTYLELFNCVMDPPPPTFKGFLFLKCLIIQEVRVFPSNPLLSRRRVQTVAGSEPGLEIQASQKGSHCGIESLVANSPLLERLELIEWGNPGLRISAPNLKYLDLKGDYTELCLHAPLLAEMSVRLFDDDFTATPSQQKSSVCNYTNFFGGFTNLEKFSGDVYFTKYLSIGIESCHHSLVLNHLKVIELNTMNFEDIKEVSAVARLIFGAPNLQELEISTCVISGGYDALEAPYVSFRDFGCSPNFKFEKLRVVFMYCAGFLPPAMVEFIKFLLQCSPVLETMKVELSPRLPTEERQNMRAELLGFFRASPDAKLIFINKHF